MKDLPPNPGENYQTQDSSLGNITGVDFGLLNDRSVNRTKPIETPQHDNQSPKSANESYID